MAYRTNYRGSRSARPQGSGKWMDLRYSGSCAVCGGSLPAGTRAFYDPRDRSVTCATIECADANGLTEEVWSGSPTSGRYVKRLSERRMEAFVGTVRRGSGSRVIDGERVFMRRCEDAPCCGCCS